MSDKSAVEARVEQHGGDRYVVIDTASRSAPDNRPVTLDADAARSLAATLKDAAESADPSS